MSFTKSQVRFFLRSRSSAKSKNSFAPGLALRSHPQFLAIWVQGVAMSEEQDTLLDLPGTAPRTRPKKSRDPRHTNMTSFEVRESSGGLFSKVERDVNR